MTLMLEQLDLDHLTYDDLMALRNRIDKQIANQEAADFQKARAKLLALANKSGYSVDALVKGKMPKTPKHKQPGHTPQPKPPRYQNPEDETQTWSGIGRKPQWVRDLLDQGTELEALRIPDRDT